ncbi:MAG: right-handed parallel beta-helix repeat-containing protein [Planctomycetaceae bacterium]
MLAQLFSNTRASRRRRPARTAYQDVENLEVRQMLTSYFVTPSGNDSGPGTVVNPFATVQHALNVADEPGDVVSVGAGRYFEKIELPHSGSADEGFITLITASGAILDGTGVNGENMVLIENQNHVKVVGFEIVNNSGVTDGSGIRILGASHHVELLNNEIHEMRGENAMGITVYGTEKTAMTDIVIDGNQIYDSEPAPSEALTINGNVTDWVISNNEVHDVNSIGIDAIGGERDIQKSKRKVARNGVISDNLVYRARSNYEGGYGAGIYVDGGKSIVVERNEVYESDLGIEIGAENRGVKSTNITVRNNLVHNNDKAGIVFGGYAKNTGRVQKSYIHNNTVYNNDTLNEGVGQLWIQFANRNYVTNNIFVASSNDVMMYSEKGTGKNFVSNNVWYTTSGDAAAEFTYRGTFYDSFSDYQENSRVGSGSVFGDPAFVNAAAGNFKLTAASVARDVGTTADKLFAETDFDQVFRNSASGVDAGAFEF